jgi:hypothetical protein
VGPPVGEHEAVAKKIAFIAGSTYGMEAMLELSCLLADDDRNDIRIEARWSSSTRASWPGRSPTS